MSEERVCIVDYNASVNQTIKDYLSNGWELLKMTAHAYRSVLTFKKEIV